MTLSINPEQWLDERIVNVLFLCPDNAGRSLIAESLLNCAGGGRYWAYSAGSCPAAEADPQAIQALRDAGLPVGGLWPKDWLRFTRANAPVMDLIVSLTPYIPHSVIPAFPGRPLTASWDVDDLTGLQNSAEGRIAAYKDMLRQIEGRVIRLSDISGIPARSDIGDRKSQPKTLWDELSRKWAA